MSSLTKRRLLLLLASKSREQIILSKGFTLVELMIVVVIVGILAAVALPNFLNQQNKAKASCAKTQVSALAKEQQVFFAENSSFAADFTALGTTAPAKCTGYGAATLSNTQVQASPTDATNGFCVTATLANGSYTMAEKKGACT